MENVNMMDLLATASDVQIVNQDNLKKLSELVEKHRTYTDFINELEERVKNGKRLVRQIEEDLIPSVMNECGISDYSLPDGTKVKTTPIVAGSIPSQGAVDKAKTAEEREELMEKRQQAFDWLSSHGGGSLIKYEFAFRLGKGEEAESEKESLIKFAEENGLAYEDSESVHAQSLNAFLKEKIQNGDDVPVETFGLFVGEKAKITKLKVK